MVQARTSFCIWVLWCLVSPLFLPGAQRQLQQASADTLLLGTQGSTEGPGSGLGRAASLRQRSPVTAEGSCGLGVWQGRTYVTAERALGPPQGAASCGLLAPLFGRKCHRQPEF